MITGDAALTGVHVAREVGMVSPTQPMLLLQTATAAVSLLNRSPLLSSLLHAGPAPREDRERPLLKWALVPSGGVSVCVCVCVAGGKRSPERRSSHGRKAG